MTISARTQYRSGLRLVRLGMILALASITGPALAQQANAVLAPQTTPAPAPVLPSLDAARALPFSEVMGLATLTLLGPNRNLDYGFSLLMDPVKRGNRMAVRLLAKAIASNEYSFGSNSNIVINALATEAMQGSASAIIAWAIMHDRGVDVPKDEAAAYKWYRWAAFVGSDTGRELTALALAQGKGTSADKAQALVWADRMSPLRRSDAYLELAELFSTGPEPMRDLALAERLALESSSLDPVNARNAAELLRTISTTPAVLAQAQKLLEAAAVAGDPKALSALNEAGDRTDGTTDVVEALGLYASLASQGNAQAVRVLVNFLPLPGVSAEDRATLVTALQGGAEAGSIDAMKALAKAHQYGTGIDISFERATELYKQAAELGDAEAQYLLAMMYANAIGTPQDLLEARNWLKKSADAGYQIARLSLDSIAGL